MKVPWGEAGARFTALFEALAIDFLKEASISGVAELLGLSWDEVDGIMGRAVKRGLARRAPQLPKKIGVDETSFQKRHEYVTVVNDLEDGVVAEVMDGRGKEELAAFYKKFPEEERAKVEVVAMDMHEPFISATKEGLPNGETKIAFDKFHVAMHLGEAVDKVRREENKALLAQGDKSLVHSKYKWLKNPANFTAQKWKDFAALRKGQLRTARAWAIKETAMQLWDYQSFAWAQRAWLRWYSWAIRSRLEPMKAKARMVLSHLRGIIRAIISKVTNAKSEGVNAKIQWIKFMARGFRNRERFRNAIYFHLAGLNLYPQGRKSVV